MNKSKKSLGQYYTDKNPFEFPHIQAIIKRWKGKIIDPFVGNGALFKFFNAITDKKVTYYGYDIQPIQEKAIPFHFNQRNSFDNFPIGDYYLTNPPWLSKATSSRNKLNPTTKIIYRDLYFNALWEISKDCWDQKEALILVPASFLNQIYYLPTSIIAHLHSYTLLTGVYFMDTKTPVALLHWGKLNPKNAELYENGTKLPIGVDDLENLKKRFEMFNRGGIPIQFNDPKGQWGIITFDSVNPKNGTIRFVLGEDIPDKYVKKSARHYVRFSLGRNYSLESRILIIKKLNETLNEIRKEYFDLWLTPFFGLRSDEKYRRRIPMSLVKSLVQYIFLTTKEKMV